MAKKNGVRRVKNQCKSGVNIAARWLKNIVGGGQHKSHKITWFSI